MENGFSEQSQDYSAADPSYRILMNSIQKRTESLSQTPCNWSIYRVPARLRQLNEDAYTPRIVSIGPFHSGQEKLQAMEVHKTRYMQSLIQRTLEPKVTVSDCAKAIVSMEKRARFCYAEFDDQNTGGSHQRRTLAEILLVDGCFILELFLRWTTSSGDPNNDPIFGSAWMIYCLQRDLALLENQIPFFVLECLFELIMGRIPKRPPSSLNELCVLFFQSFLNINEGGANDHKYRGRNTHGGRHLLDLIRNCYLPSYPKTKPKREQSLAFIHCTTKLIECGIKFVKGDSENLFDIKFGENGVLEIPRLFIHDSTDALLRNLIAFEQCCQDISHHITSYVVLMDRLIDSPRDAEILETKRIIINYLGHGEEVSKLFNKICKEVVVKDFFFAALCEQVDEYYHSWWPRNKSVMTRDYCSSPCRFISFLAASVLLFLTVFQTAYSIASYYPH